MIWKEMPEREWKEMKLFKIQVQLQLIIPSFHHLIIPSLHHLIISFNHFSVVCLGTGVGQVARKYKTLNDQQKFAAYVAMHTLCMSRGGTFLGTDKQDIAIFFGVGVWSIQRIWRKAMRQISEGKEVDVSNKKKEILEESLRTLI